MRSLLAAALIALAAAPAAARASRIDKASHAVASEILKAKLPRGASVAVLPFENPRRQAVELGRLIADGVTNELVASGRVTAVDRAFLSRLLGEIKMNQTGLTDQAAALELGKFSGANYMLLGAFETYGSKRLILQFKLIETEKAVLVAAGRVTLKLDKEMRALYAKGAALDAVAGAMAVSVEEAGDAFFLNQNGPDGCRWLESRAEAGFGTGGRAAARAAALTLARDRALRKVLGRGNAPVDFSDGAVARQTEAVLRAVRSGRVVEEKILEDKKAGDLYRVVLQTCLDAPAKSADKDFTVQLMLNQHRFAPGQEARAILTSSRRAWIYLYSVDFDLRVARVFPVEAAPENRIEPGRPFQFPGPDHSAAGIRLTAELPKGAADSVETLRVIAVKRDVGTLLDGAASYPELVRRLSDSGDEWTEDVRVFAIHK